MTDLSNLLLKFFTHEYRKLQNNTPENTRCHDENVRQHLKLVPRICSALVLYIANLSFFGMRQRQEIQDYLVVTCRMVKFSSTLFIIYFSGRCFSLWMKLIMYSHMGERWIRYTKRPFSNLAYSVSTFSTTCLPNEHTLVEHVMVMFSLLSYLQKTEHPIITFILRGRLN